LRPYFALRILFFVLFVTFVGSFLRNVLGDCSPEERLKRPGTPPPDLAVTGADLDARRSQRLRTVELLRGGHTPLQVIAVAEHAAGLVDQTTGAPHRPPFACREGCAWCCHKVVGSGAPEVFRILDYLERNASPEELRNTRDRVLRLEAQRDALTGDRWAAARLPCPLLVNDRCAVYPVRPLTCRGYGSTDAAACERHVRSRARVEVPLAAAPQRRATLVLDGLLAGLTESRLPGDRLALG
jgi:Fe-S-cluster containining protein